VHGSGQCGCRSNRPNVPLEREPWLDFQEVMEWPGSGIAKIAFHRGNEPFHTIEVGEPPVVSIEEPVREESYLTVKVSASHPREQVTVVVLFSADYGSTWQPVAFDPPEGKVKIHMDRLPGGDRCLVRAIATAQLRSATADTQPLTLPRNARRLYMSLPKHDCPIWPGPVSLSVAVDTRGLGAIAPADIRWSSSLDGKLGFGHALTADLREGQHEVTVTAPDGLGGTVAEHGTIIVGGRSQPRQ